MSTSYWMFLTSDTSCIVYFFITSKNYNLIFDATSFTSPIILGRDSLNASTDPLNVSIADE